MGGKKDGRVKGRPRLSKGRAKRAGSLLYSRWVLAGADEANVDYQV